MPNQSATHIANFTVPGVRKAPAAETITILQERLNALIDLQLTLKHIHWNVVGPNFIGVHEMLDPQVENIQEMTDTIAERIATLGGVPIGTPGSIAARRDTNDYSLGRATVNEHLGALDFFYGRINEKHRYALSEVAELDPVSEDMLVGQLAALEQYQWFVRAHLECSQGHLPTVGSTSELSAAAAADSA